MLHRYKEGILLQRSAPESPGYDVPFDAHPLPYPYSILCMDEPICRRLGFIHKRRAVAPFTLRTGQLSPEPAPIECSHSGK